MKYGEPLINRAGVLIRGKFRHTKREEDVNTHDGWPCDDRGETGAIRLAHHGLRRTATSRKREGRILLWRFQRKHGPAHTLVSDLRPLKLGENVFLLFQAIQFSVRCYSNPRKLIVTAI